MFFIDFFVYFIEYIIFVKKKLIFYLQKNERKKPNYPNL